MHTYMHTRIFSEAVDGLGVCVHVSEGVAKVFVGDAHEGRVVQLPRHLERLGVVQ